jgi:hypothetical protein
MRVMDGEVTHVLYFDREGRMPETLLPSQDMNIIIDYFEHNQSSTGLD